MKTIQEVESEQNIDLLMQKPPIRVADETAAHLGNHLSQTSTTKEIELQSLRIELEGPQESILKNTV